MSFIRFTASQLSPSFIIKSQYQIPVFHHAIGVATSVTSYSSHSPPESLKVLIPLSELIPAPVSITSVSFFYNYAKDILIS